MTLAVACLTPEFVTLVIDRRVTRGPVVLDDFATKMVLICDRGAVGYSGLAEFPGGEPKMDQWILQTLANAKVSTLSDAARVLRVEGTKAFRAIGYPREHKRHAFLIAGWSVSAPNVRHPAMCVVSNALDDNWEWLGKAEEEFRQRALVQVDPKKFSFSSIGVPVRQELRDSLRRTLRRGFRRGLGPMGVLQLCVRMIRMVASSDPLVGRDLLAVCVPPCSLTAGSRWVVAGPPDPNAITFLDIRQSSHPVWHGPHFVCGGSAFSDFEVGTFPQAS